MFIFREIIVDDKKLAPFLRAINGLVVSMTPPQPVVNAEKRNGKVEALTDGTVQAMFEAHLKQDGVKEFTIDDARKWLKDQGRSPLSYGYLLKKLCKAKRIKMTDTRGLYTVVT